MYYRNGQDFKNANGHELNGRWYPRVTKILEVKSKPALQSFFKEVGSFASAESIKNKSAEEGLLLHSVIQAFLCGKTITVPDSIMAAISSFEQFNAHKKIRLHPEFVERPIWSSEHRYSGTVDALATIDGKFGVLDIKTSVAFYPEYNLQTSAYMQALQELGTKKDLRLDGNVQTRWILRIDQKRKCKKCDATLREKGGRKKIRNGIRGGNKICGKEEHEWGETEGETELKEFPYYHNDFRAFSAAKILWEWENEYWLKQIKYI